MITLLSAAADAVTNEFCFDCPDESLGFYAESIAVGLGISLILAIPGFFVGMLLNRMLVRSWLAVRLLLVAAFVSVFWLLLIGRIDIAIASASLLAAFASYFDSLRVNAENSSKSFSDY